MRLLALSAALVVLLASCSVDARRRPTVAVPEFVPPPPTPVPELVAAEAPEAEPEAGESGAVSGPRIVRRDETPRRETSRAESPPPRSQAPPEPRIPRRERAASEILSTGPRSLASLAAERSRLQDSESYVLGPGDMISVTVFDLDEMNRKVRVSRRGEIQLPLIGSVKAAGRSETDLAREIAGRLDREYLQDPQVDVFVEEYRSQQVAVTGAVSKPGLVALTRDRYTILDVISEAGGLTKDAGSIVEFIPARGGRRSRAFDAARSAVTSGENLSGQGIQIPLGDLMRGSNRSNVNLPVVAGDVVYVPEAGSFSLSGWIEKAGTYPLTRGMTVLGALSAGGGPLFPASLGSVEVYRGGTVTGNAREVLEVDVDGIKDGTVLDVPLQAGDVIRVPANPLLVPPWLFYQLVKDLIRLGASVPVA